jgi:two-component system, LuxR family, sensor kinase FixL
VLLVALLLSAPRHWAWPLAIVFPVHVLAQAQYGVGFSAALLFYVGDCLLVATTAAAMRRWGLANLTLSDLRQTLTFLAVVTSAAAVGSLAWSAMGEWLRSGWDLRGSWNLIFLSNVLPFLIFTPGLMAVAIRGAKIARETSPKSQVEFGALVLGLLACGLGVFGFDAPHVENLPALLYLPLPFLLWAAVRFGAPGLSLSFSMFALLAIVNAVAGRGPFVMQSTASNVLWIQAFLLALYVPLLVLAAVLQERKDKEKALRDSEARYRAVVEDQTELICRFLPDGTYTFVNDAYCRFFGSSRQELLGRSFWTFFPPAGDQAARDFLATITPEHQVATREREVVTTTGEPRWQQWTDRGFFDAQGHVVEYQAVGHDITERKHLEEAMRSIAHVERLAVVGELTGSIVHELAQPLTAILVNADAADKELQRQSPSLDELRMMVTDIRCDDLRASEVMQRMRGLLRKRAPVMSTFRIDELVAEVAELVRPEATRRKVKFETALDAKSADIHGDRVQLQQVLLNLVLNGMDAMGAIPVEQRRLVVRSERDGNEHVRVSVTDRGDGIPADRLSRVFESFYTTKEHGMGLGLAIARSIVDLHGGRIWAVNDLGGGAAFRFTLPIAAAAVNREDSRPPTEGGT